MAPKKGVRTGSRVLWLTGCFLLALIARAPQVQAADRYWVGVDNSGSDSWTDINNWSTEVAGAGGASVPGTSDIAIFSVSGGTVQLKDATSVGGILFANTWTGTFIQGTGALAIGSNDFRMGSGTFVGETGALGINGDFTQTGGVVQNIQGSLTLSGSFSLNNGGGSGIPNPSFSASTGTLVFDGAADQNFIIAADSVTATLGSLTLNNSGGGSSDDVTMSGSLSLSGALTITLGNLDLDTFNSVLRVESGITIANDAQATLVTDANLTVSGSLTVNNDATFTMSGTSTLTLNGIDQTLDTNNSKLINLTINSSSGTTLGNNESVHGALQINTGSVLTLSTYTLYATGASVSNFASLTENTGKLVHTGSTVLVADSTYAEVTGITSGNTAFFTITDADENIDGTAIDTLTGSVVLGGDSEILTFTETSNTSGIFRTSIVTSDVESSATSNNGNLQSKTDGTITLTYTDQQDGLIATDSAAFTAVDITVGTGGGGGGGGGGGSRRGGVLRAQGVNRRFTTGEVVESESPAPQQLATKMPWTDVQPNDKHVAAALTLYDAGIVLGHDDGTVRLMDSLTRAEALTLLVRTLGEKDQPYKALPFTDVDQSAWYAGPLRYALANKIVQGLPDNTFRPGSTLNLVQSLKIISIGLGLASQTDERVAARWFDPYVTVARTAGLIEGQLTPERAVSRGEFFSWLVLLLSQ